VLEKDQVCGDRACWGDLFPQMTDYQTFFSRTVGAEEIDQYKASAPRVPVRAWGR